MFRRSDATTEPSDLRPALLVGVLKGVALPAAAAPVGREASVGVSADSGRDVPVEGDLLVVCDRRVL